MWACALSKGCISPIFGFIFKLWTNQKSLYYLLHIIYNLQSGWYRYLWLVYSYMWGEKGL